MSNDLVAAIRRVGGEVEDLPFWQGCREGRFLLHRCGTCGRHYWPASRCVEHGPAAMEWVEASGEGEVYTYTVMHHAYTQAMKDKVPYAVAVVKLAEGPFYHANVVGCPAGAVHVGLAVRAEMAEHDSGLTIPVFRPA